MFVRKALHGLKSSSAAFQAHLAEALHDIGFRPTRADPDVWRRPAKRLMARNTTNIFCAMLMTY